MRAHAAILVFVLASTPLVAQPAAPTALSPGAPCEVVIDLAGTTARTFAVDVPDGAFALSIVVSDTPLDVSITAVRDGAENEATGADNALVITRADKNPLETGKYLVTIDYEGAAPYYRGRQLSKAPYTVVAKLVSPRVEATLRPDATYSGRIVAAEGRMRTFAIEVPVNAKALRVDLDGTVADLDLYLRKDKLIVTPDDADHSATTTASRDWIVIDAASDPPLESGRYCLMVYEQTGQDTACFSLHVRFDSAPPPALLEIPRVPPGSSVLERAAAACVQLSIGIDGGSGTIVSPDGLVLTNHHVIASAIPMLRREGRVFASRDAILAPRPTGTAASGLDEIVIGATLDARHPPVELFRGQLLAFDADADLALVRITTGYYGQPLPAGYAFPSIPLGDPVSLRLGDPLHFVGFPSIASLRTRPTITVTRGIVSGFEDSDDGRSRIRSDGLISGGNSGGSAIDAKGELIGIPSMTTDEGGPQSFGYTFSITELPRTWRALIELARVGAASGSGK